MKNDNNLSWLCKLQIANCHDQSICLSYKSDKALTLYSFAYSAETIDCLKSLQVLMSEKVSQPAN